MSKKIYDPPKAKNLNDLSHPTDIDFHLKIIIHVDQAGTETSRYFKDDQEIDEHDFQELSWRGYTVKYIPPEVQ
jgi:hypothetical protein